MRVPFRGVRVREAALVRGPAGWGEFSPFLEYEPGEASRWLGATVVVQNVPGGSGTIGTVRILTAQPDGYTIGYGHNSPLAIQPHKNPDLPYKGVEDFTTIGGIGYQSGTVSVNSASEWQTFWNVIIPYMKPGIIAGALLAFTLSLDDFVITFFTSGLETVTFPVKVYSLVRRGVSPEINAASTVLIVITVVATVIAMKLQAQPKKD